MQTLPLPPHYDSSAVVDDIRWLDYVGLQGAAIDWRKQHNLQAASVDHQRGTKIALLDIDSQNSFCHPKGELFVAGRSGTGAIDDSQRTAEFIYRNMGVITDIYPTLDTHRAYAVFHPAFLINDAGDNPAPFTMVSHQDILDGVWKASPFMASALSIHLTAAQKQLEWYTSELERTGRYNLTIWPYHVMLGGKGHSLVSGIEEACFFHSIARGSLTGFEVKGTNSFTENYSVLGPEVVNDFNGRPLTQRNTTFIQKLLEYDVLVIAGQAKSHCVAWSIEDLLRDITSTDPALASKVYLLGDCTSPVVIPGVHDYTDEADAAFDRFVNAGMNLVNSTDPIDSWPGIKIS